MLSLQLYLVFVNVLNPLPFRSMVKCLHYFYVAVKLIYLKIPDIFAVRPNTIGYETVKLIRNEKWS